LDSKSSDSLSEDLLAEDEVAGTQVEVPLREDGAYVLDADLPAPDLQQVGYETSSISDNEDLLRTPRRPSPRREREEREDDSSTGSSGDNDYHVYGDNGGMKHYEKFEVSFWYAYLIDNSLTLINSHLHIFASILCIVLGPPNYENIHE